MKPPPFEYFAAESLEEALEVLAVHGDEAKALAGGQSLIPLLNFRLARPTVIVDLNGIHELGRLTPLPSGGIAVGAMARQRDAERSSLISARAPLVTEAMPYVAHPQIRNRGTFGGSIAHADPAAELPAVALALDAKFSARSRERGDRWIDAADFFVGPLTTVLQADELLTEVELPPLPAGAGWAFVEAARRHGDYALLGVAAVVALNSAGECSHVRLTFVNAGGTPMRGRSAEKLLIGQQPDEEVFRAAGESAATTDIDPVGDVHATAAYRRQLARVLTVRALEQAFQVAVVALARAGATAGV
ncbi:MAG: xanthine dehydrogenase family protein subunit M [Gemmatimonadota bacterium]|nr:xanthine dehydrogenase family protein subunit M [Gemmatimonadota bacterium]